MKEVSVNKKLD